VNQIGMPFSANNWPSIGKLTPTVVCRALKAHRLYNAIGIPCPCGPCCMNITDLNEREVKFYSNDIVFFEKGQEVSKLSDLFSKIRQLEQEVKELKGK